MKKQLTALFACLTLMAAPASWAEEPASLRSPVPLPGTDADRAFDALAARIDLESPALRFEYKRGTHQGSSVGFHISIADGHKKWSFAPENRSNNVEAEIINYRLSRVLGFSQLYNPVTFYRLGPNATKRFKALLDAARESDPDRSANRRRTLNDLAVIRDGIVGTLRNRISHRRRFLISSLIINPPGHLNTGARLAKLIQADGPPPTDKLISLPDVKGQNPKGSRPVEREIELVRQLSNILVIDQLTGQWDRFVSNLEGAEVSNGRVQFVARDNGGATVDDWEWHNLYEKWITRFDRVTVDKLTALNVFLQGKSPEFQGFHSPQEFKVAMGFLKQASFDTFAQKLKKLIEVELPALQRKYGARAYIDLSVNK